MPAVNTGAGDTGYVRGPLDIIGNGPLFFWNDQTLGCSSAHVTTNSAPSYVVGGQGETRPSSQRHPYYQMVIFKNSIGNLSVYDLLSDNSIDLGVQLL